MFCLILAQNAVHGAMAGFTAFSVGLVNNRVVYIPISRYVYMFECGSRDV
jgi:6-phosphofructokinase 1